ncbi:MAG TPA: energy transducer TonB [Longimicrobiaceae bacterium]|nr:energy transducer TonB [Longimicrobiaceae bacterium]
MKGYRFLLPAAALVYLFTGVAGCAREQPPETPPRQITASPFHYPEDLWDEGVEGETMLRIFVTDQGAVDTVRVEKTSGYEAFDSAAVQGAQVLRFEPARRGEDPVGTWVLLPVQFDMVNANAQREDSP